MIVSGYTSDELKLFYRVLDAAMSEGTGGNLKVPLHTMTKRLFDAAATGERNPERLKAAVFGTIEAGAGTFPSGPYEPQATPVT
jgi:hypothetical protein